jgi:hypothetical protein
MGIKRIGQFLELVSEDGLRNLVRVNAIQWICDVDAFQQETWLTVANRTILIRESLDDIRVALLDVRTPPS